MPTSLPAPPAHGQFFFCTHARTDPFFLLTPDFFRQAERGIPKLAGLYPDFTGDNLVLNGTLSYLEPDDSQQMSLVLAEGHPGHGSNPRTKARRTTTKVC